MDDDPAPVSEWLPWAAAAAGAKPPRHVPKWLGRLLAGDVPATRQAHHRSRKEAEHWLRS